MITTTLIYRLILLDGFYNLILWSVIETNIAVVSACLPTLRPALEIPLKAFKARFSSSRRTHSQENQSEEGLPINEPRRGVSQLTELRTLSSSGVSTSQGSAVSFEYNVPVTKSEASSLSLQLQLAPKAS